MSLRLLLFEVRYQLRQLSFRAAGGVLLLLGVALSRLSLGGEGVPPDAAWSVTLNLGLLSLLSVFVASALTARTALRDRETGMEELIRSTPVGRRTLAPHVLGGLLAAHLLLLALPVVVMAAASALTDPGGGLAPGRYLWAYGVVVVPNTAFLVALLYAVARASGSALAVHLGGVGVYLGYFGLSVAGGSPLIAGSGGGGASAAAALLDPFGIVPFLDGTRTWTAEQMSSLPVGWEGALLHNRLLWLAAALLLAWLAVRVESAGGLVGRARRTVASSSAAGAGRDAGAAGRRETGGDENAGSGTPGGDDGVPDDAVRRPGPGRLPVAGAPPRVAQEPSGRRHWVRSAVSGARVQTARVLGSVPLAVVGLLWVALVVTSLGEAVGDGPPFFDTPYLPLTELIVPALLRPFQLLGSLVLIFLAGELAWADRSAGMHPLVDATPMPNGARLASTVLSLGILSLGLATLTMGPAVGYQLARGGTPDPVAYAGLVYLLAAPWLLFGVLSVGIQNLSPDRYVGMLASAVVVVLARPIAVNVLDVDLPFLPYAWAADLDYSVFSGFGPFLGAFHAHMVFWTVVGVAGCALAVRTWRRGVDPGVRARVGGWLRGRPRPSLRAAAVALGGVLVTGSALQVAVTDQGALVSEGQRELWRAEYERRLSGLAGLRSPTVDAVDLTFDLYPDDRRYEVTGTYRLVNRSGAPLDSVVVGWDRWISDRRVRVEGAGPGRERVPFDHVVFVMDEPLAPGASTEMEFAFEVHRTSFGEFDPAHQVLADGSFVRLERKLPWLGYEPGLELDDPEARETYGLPAERLGPLPGAGNGGPGVGDDVGRRPASSGGVGADVKDAGGRGEADAAGGRARARYTLTASTAAGQRIAAPGRLVGSWTAGGRSHFRFVSEGPMRRRYGIASASWERRTVRASTGGRPDAAPGSAGRRAVGTASGRPGVDVHVLHHPRHRANVGRLAEAAATSVDVLSGLYGPMGRRSVTIAEIPSYHAEGVQATSYPGALFVREHGAWTGDFATLAEGEVDYLWRRVAHELAHQWWGDRLAPDRTAPGAAVLTETMAEHSAGRVLEHRFGAATHRSLLRWQTEQFLRLRGRMGGEEPPLLGVGPATDYVAYFKGPIVLNAVAGLIGDDALDDLLAGFMGRHGADAAVPDADPPSVDDLYGRLREAVPERRRPLLAEWFGSTVVYDLRVESASSRALPDGRFEVTAGVVLEKRGPEGGPGDGRDAAGEPVAIEVSGHGGEGAAAAVVERTTVELRPGRQTVSVVVGFRPSALELDPDVTRVDVDRENNVRTVEGGA